MDAIKQCECGRWAGGDCSHTDGPRVQIAYVPECLQDSTVAAGTKHGCWSIIAVHPDCAAEMLELDPEWVEAL